MGRFGVVQTSCTNRRARAIPEVTDEAFKPCHNVGGVILAPDCFFKQQFGGMFLQAAAYLGFFFLTEQT